MRRHLPLVVPAAVTLLLSACSSILDAEDERWCPTGDPAPLACARLVALIEGPPEPWPVRRRFVLRARPARDVPLGFVSQPDTGANPIVIRSHLAPIEELGDTVSMWFRAALLEDPRPVVVGKPLPVFAADSLLHVVDFSVRRVDTLRLHLRRR